MSLRRRTWLQGTLCALAAGGAALASADESARANRRLQFPRDHGAHPATAIEWWYLTGWLATADEQRKPRYGFQITFFRSRTGLAENLDSRFAARQLLFAHAALTDLHERRHLHSQRFARWSGDAGSSLASASSTDTAVHIGNWFLRREGGQGFSRYVTQFAVSDRSGQDLELDLQLQAVQPPLLQGQDGYSQKGPDAVQASHYVSEPQLQARGLLRRADRSTRLNGRGWLDHEWSDHLMPAGAVGWDWIGINLDSGAALTAFQLRRADHSRLWAGGSWRASDGSFINFAADAVRFVPLRHWQSPATGARYPVEWTVETPAGRFGVRALLDAQELDSRTGTGSAYWEGLSEVTDTDGRRIGLGYLEMTGYAGVLKLGD